MTKPPPTQDNAGLVEAQDRRRLALVERIGTFTDLLCSDPLPGETGDVAYDLLRRAAAQISSDRLHLARLTPPVETAANADDGLAGELQERLSSSVGFDGLGRWLDRNGDRLLSALRTTREATDES